MKSVKCLEFDEKLQFSIFEEFESLPKVCKINKELRLLRGELPKCYAHLLMKLYSILGADGQLPKRHEQLKLVTNSHIEMVSPAVEHDSQTRGSRFKSLTSNSPL